MGSIVGFTKQLPMLSRVSSPAMNQPPPFPSLLLLFFLSSSTFYVANAISANTVVDSPLLTQKIGTNRTIKVDINGKGDFKSVQAAIDSVPSGNDKWIIIHVRKGEYKEKVHIPKDKPYIFMRGNGKGRSWIVWSQSSADNVESAVFKVEASHFIAFGISFKNAAPTGVAFTSQNQSVAAFVAADMAAFYHCGFYSTHNTLFDYKGRHYYDNSYIQGSIDFIFGRARSVFHSCEIFSISDKRMAIHGSITAQNRPDADDDSGYVFVKGKVYGVGDTMYLGRAKGAYSRVIFAKVYLSKTIAPEGWTDWSYNGGSEHLYHAEYHNHGPGADTSKRVKWVKQLSEKEVSPFLSIDFIDGKQWLPAMASIAASAEADRNAVKHYRCLPSYCCFVRLTISQLREKELAAVKINPSDVDIIANELELDKKVAERTLGEHKRDAVAAIRRLLA